MHDCHACQRPVGRGWLICGWCGTNQIVRGSRRRSFKQYAGVALLLQALGQLRTDALTPLPANRGRIAECEVRIAA